MKMSRREQLIQEELRKLMWVPPGRTEEQHRTWLKAQVKWLPQAQDTQFPPSPKPPMNIQALRMLAFIRVVEKLISSAKDIEREECAATVAAKSRIPQVRYRIVLSDEFKFTPLFFSVSLW